MIFLRLRIWKNLLAIYTCEYNLFEFTFVSNIYTGFLESGRGWPHFLSLLPLNSYFYPLCYLLETRSWRGKFHPKDD